MGILHGADPSSILGTEYGTLCSAIINTKLLIEVTRKHHQFWHKNPYTCPKIVKRIIRCVCVGGKNP